MKREENRDAIQDLVYLLSCAVGGTAPEPERVRAMELGAVFALAQRHMLAAAAAMALELAGCGDTRTSLTIAVSARREAAYVAETAVVLQALEEAGVWYMPLKGRFLQELYPQAWMRQMSDCDILIDEARVGDVGFVMERLGYVPEEAFVGNHAGYVKPPMFNFEMHWTLFEARHFERLAAYYQDVKTRLIKDEGNRYGYHFRPEDFYVFMIAHEYRHYSDRGTGLRSLLDTFLFCRERGGELDWDYIGGELDRLGIAEFEARNRSLSRNLFLGEPLTGSERRMLDYILSSGAFGTTANGANNQIAKKGRWGYLLARIVPPYDLMRKDYPVLERVPLLYPFCWAHRLVYAFIFKNRVFLCQLKSILTSKR